MTFDRFALHPRIQRGVAAAGFTTPTPIQAQAIPVALEGRDLLGLAQTGTGKTAAFVLPLLQRLQDGRGRGVPRALILAPTRELAEQIHQSLRLLGRHTGLRSATVYGGVSRHAQVKALRRGVDVVVACPGRLLDLMGDHSIRLSGVEMVVLDEADRMCDMGFLPDIRRILHSLPRERQTLFFSATMPREIRGLAHEILQEPVTVQVDARAPAQTVSHAMYAVEPKDKTGLLLAWLRQTATDRVLIFTRTKRRAHYLAQDLARAGHRADELQGNLSQSQRQRAIQAFRQGRTDLLVATDVAARGIHVTAISHVVNFDMPDTVDAYIHRIGRTGRAGDHGTAITLVTATDFGMVHQIERLLGKPLERLQMAGFAPPQPGHRPGRGPVRGRNRRGPRGRSRLPARRVRR